MELWQTLPDRRAIFAASRRDPRDFKERTVADMNTCLLEETDCSYVTGVLLGESCKRPLVVGIPIDESSSPGNIYTAGPAMLDDVRADFWTGVLSQPEICQVHDPSTDWTYLNPFFVLIRNAYLEDPTEPLTPDNRLLNELSGGTIRFSGNIVVVKVDESGQVVNLAEEDIPSVREAIASRAKQINRFWGHS
ncbi:hypothetical protein NP233_g1997 [Leucocoprinus birnbaumii]|uniref:Uncharacterized protein n=1 Tax=Leucocoprinus birnbaumii TaxID=56174 RepID=A0AAD5W319_9AGAR|nr:hypothetical protein NP233_g1997 [Leucocoprinus birnbaumii]